MPSNVVIKSEGNLSLAARQLSAKCFLVQRACVLSTETGAPVHLLRVINLLKPTGHLMHQQFNIQQLYVLPTLYLCVLYLSEHKQRLVTLTA